MVVNVAELVFGTNIAHWFMIINSWTNGFLMSGIVLIVALIVFGISVKSGTEQTKAFMGTSFAMFLVSSVGWFVRWNSPDLGQLQLISTFMPMFFLFMTGLGVLFVLIGPRIFNNS